MTRDERVAAAEFHIRTAVIILRKASAELLAAGREVKAADIDEAIIYAEGVLTCQPS